MRISAKPWIYLASSLALCLLAAASLALATGCGGNRILVVDPGGAPIEGALVVTYDAPYLFDDREVGAQLTDPEGVADRLPEIDYLAVLKPGFHPVLGPWPRESHGDGRIVLYRIGGRPTATLRGARGDGEADSFEGWIPLKHDLGSGLQLAYKARTRIFTAPDSSAGELRISSSRHSLARVGRTFWSSETGARLSKELVLRGTGASFVIGAGEGAVTARVYLDDVIIATGKAGNSVSVFFVVAEGQGIENAVEPPLVICDEGLPFFGLAEHRALVFFSIHDDHSGGFRGPLPAQKAESLFTEYVTSYRERVPKAQWNRLVELHQLMAGSTKLEPISD